MIPRANVYDLRHRKPEPNLRYFIDTNILVYVFAPSASNRAPGQMAYYVGFFQELLKEGQMIFTSPQNILEFFGVFDSFEKALQEVESIKTYREQNIEAYFATRSQYLDDIQQSKIQILDARFSVAQIRSYLKLDFSIDADDYLYYDSFRDDNLAIVSDDREFMYIDGLNFFTANGTAIERASRVKKLM